MILFTENKDCKRSTKANERYVNKPRSVAESIYRMSRTKAKTQRESPQQSQPRQKSPND